MKNHKDYRIVQYKSELEDSWIRCKALSYLYSRFNDQIEPKKDTYSLDDGYAEAIELVAVNQENVVVGILDIGLYNDDRNTYDPYVRHLEKGSYMDIIAVHPDYQNRGIAQSLINEASTILREKEIDYVTIFTRDDKAANSLYNKLGATIISSNYRVKGSLKDARERISSFKVNTDQQKIEVLNIKGNEMPYMFDTGFYWVYNKNNLELFDIEECISEHTYVLYL